MTYNQPLSNYIYRCSGGAKNETLDRVVYYFDNEEDWKQSTFSSSLGKTGTQKVEMDEMWIAPKTRSYDYFKTILLKAVKEYQQKFPFCQVQTNTAFRMNRYGTGGFMKNHVDSIHHSHGQKFGYPHITSLLFLNSKFKGGNFNLCGESFEMEQGEILIFPSNFMFPHSVEKVTSGKRFTLMGWWM